jgi:hypothetical protein
VSAPHREIWLEQDEDGNVREYVPSRSPRRLLRDDSEGRADRQFAVEATVLFEKIKRAGGTASIAALRRTGPRASGLQSRGVLDDAIGDLERVGVASSHRGIVTLAPGFEDLRLISSWSRVG